MSFSISRNLSYAAVTVSGLVWTNHCGALLTLQQQLFHFPGKTHGIKLLLYPGDFYKDFPVNFAVFSRDLKHS